MSQPFSLSTDRLVLRPFVESDLEDLQRFHTNAKVQQGYDVDGRAWPCEVIADRLKAYISEQERHGFSRWKLSLKSEEFVGRAGLSWFVVGESAELGFGLLPDYWGCGYAQETATALIRWGFDHLPIEKIIAFTFPANRRSQRTLAAAGMTYVDVRVRSAKDGPCAYYEMMRRQVAAG